MSIRAAKALLSLHICTGSAEVSLLAKSHVLCQIPHQLVACWVIFPVNVMSADFLQN